MKDHIRIAGRDIETYTFDTIVVGTGAAGYNAADSLHSLGVIDTAMVTEGVRMGTSRNTGSDKQTYYKLTTAGDIPDSVMDMAEALFSGGSMHGDVALVEAALSGRCFYKLVDSGVPFPHNRYGEYVGYKTDHDPRQRATSCGPLTSRLMTERLEERVRAKDIPVFDGHRVIAVLTDGDSCPGKVSAVGLLTVRPDESSPDGIGLTLFNCRDIVYAVGGPAGMYLDSVYPESQTGAMGAAFEAGARGINLTESQYGLASVKFRWNLSGTYQQVIPTYVSTEADGSDPREFLDDHFVHPGEMMDAIFLKGYQWPFDPRKLKGSSIIDILVYAETHVKGRRVLMDFRRNPSRAMRDGGFDFDILGAEARNYLERSGALFGRPIDRLAKMNQPAIDLYAHHGIDLTSEPLEVAVCAQHSNGGLLGDIWWKSNIEHLFPVGEVNGTFGVYRPGGSALNSTQVGGVRAAQYISADRSNGSRSLDDFKLMVERQVATKIGSIVALQARGRDMGSGPNVVELRRRYQARMSRAGAIMRDASEVADALDECLGDIRAFSENTIATSPMWIREALINYDILITQFAYLTAISEYIRAGGGSRGSYLVPDVPAKPLDAGMADMGRYPLDNGAFSDRVCEVWLEDDGNGGFRACTEWKPVRPIPRGDDWFENVWNAYMKGNIIG